MDDSTLLRRYVAERSDPAFRELVQRHIDFVFSVALREVRGDFARAQDVTQDVFTALARKAPALQDRPSLAGWLHISTRLAAAMLKRAEQRRQRREEESHAMNEPPDPAGAARDWTQVEPVLNELIQDLKADDREAVLLRFYRRLPYAEIGAALRLSEGAVQKRVERALEKMRQALQRRGITSTSAALALLLENNAVAAAPAGLASLITPGAVAAAKLGGGGAALLHLMSIGKLQLAAFGVLVAASVTVITLQQRTSAALRDEIAALQTEARQLAILRAENAAAKAELQTLRAGQAELTRLRSEVSAAQASAARPAPPATNISPVRALDSLRNVGNATPASALESMIWAKENLDFATLGKLFVLTPEARQKTEAIWARLPDEERAKPHLATPDEMLAYFFAGIAKQFAGLQILEERVIDADTTAVRAALPRPTGGMDRRVFVFKRSAAGWQWMFPAEAIDEIPRELSKMGAINPGSK